MGVFKKSPWKKKIRNSEIHSFARFAWCEKMGGCGAWKNQLIWHRRELWHLAIVVCAITNSMAALLLNYCFLVPFWKNNLPFVLDCCLTLKTWIFKYQLFMKVQLKLASPILIALKALSQNKTVCRFCLSHKKFLFKLQSWRQILSRVQILICQQSWFKVVANW